MPVPLPGAIDCDIHLTLPGTHTLVPYLNEYWSEHVLARGLERDSHEVSSYPPGAPLTSRADWRAPGASAIGKLQAELLDPFQLRHAVCSCLHGTHLMFNSDLAAAFCRATNDWIAAEWLDRDPRLRASITVPASSVEAAVEEIEKRAPDRRFVQVLMLVMSETPLGRRHNWPIYEAAQRHGLAVGVHAGSSFRYPLTSSGWPSYFLEDYVVQSQAFAAQLASFVCEGVFEKFPDLKVVFMESGITWLPPFLWRLNKTWRGVRIETPWLKRQPAEIIREHVRFTLQPFDAPPTADQLDRVLTQIGSDDLLLFSTDYPHWHFDGRDAVPAGLPAGLVEAMLVKNPLNTYARLSDVAPIRMEDAL